MADGPDELKRAARDIEAAMIGARIVGVSLGEHPISDDTPVLYSLELSNGAELSFSGSCDCAFVSMDTVAPAPPDRDALIQELANRITALEQAPPPRRQPGSIVRYAMPTP